MQLIYHIIILEIYVKLCLFIFLINLDINTKCSRNIGLHILYYTNFFVLDQLSPKMLFLLLRKDFKVLRL